MNDALDGASRNTAITSPPVVPSVPFVDTPDRKVEESTRAAVRSQRPLESLSAAAAESLMRRVKSLPLESGEMLDGLFLVSAPEDTQGPRVKAEWSLPALIREEMRRADSRGKVDQPLPTFDLVARAGELYSGGFTDLALDLVYDEMHCLLASNRFASIASLLQSVDVSKCETDVLMALLVTTRGCDSDVPTRPAFAMRAVEHLTSRPGFDERAVRHLKG